ncbi:MAG: c-type cytochrome [Verrucomicrobiaceae bacterium]|nr:MAG: c-type cytochrome [Verrucomicrobiaceae bacterium]
MKIPILLPLTAAFLPFALGAAAADTPPPAAQPAAATEKEPYNTEPAPEGPLSPEEAARQWKFPEGFTVSNFASEPQVRQPIAMAMDHRGRLWVAECYTYAEHKVGFAADLKDRILILEDTDGDGKMDKRTVFIEGLDKLSSIEIGFGGVWALSLPRMIFIPDKDGDDRPDGPPEAKLDGFEWKVNHHTIANGLRWGPDGWLYGRHGIQAMSHLGRPGMPDRERLAMNVGIWRYHPQRKTVEVVCEGTTNPWGMDWNEVGEAFFINTVIGHLWHVIPGAHYRRMYGTDANPYLYELIEQHADHVHWATGEAWNDWQRLGTTDATSAAGGGHAHTGLMFYAGDNWPEEHQGKLLTLNFNGRRLNEENVIPEGSGYVGRHMPDLGHSADKWFRGIDLIYGPDGGVFISDWSDSGECHDDSGVHRLSGRVYKVTHGQPKRPAIADIGALPAKDLLPLLDAKNEFMVRHARQRLQELAVSGKDLSGVREALLGRFADLPGTVAKLRALWALHAIGVDDATFLRSQLRHADKHVRTWAVRLLLDDAAKARKDTDTIAALQALALEEKEPSVRLALASALQRLPLEARAALAAPLLTRAQDAGDHNLPQMLWYGIEPLGGSDPKALAVLGRSTELPLVRRCIARRLMENSDGQQSMTLLLSQAGAAGTAWQTDVLEGISAALQGQRAAKPPGGWESAAEVFSASPDPGIRRLSRQLGNRFGDHHALEATRKIVLDVQAPAPERQDALRSLTDARTAGLHATCLQVLADPVLTATAAAGLALESDPAIAALLLKQYAVTAGADRPALISILISRPAWAGLVLDAVAAGTVPRQDLSAFHARQIRNYRDAALTEKVTKIWGDVRDSSAEKTARIAQWKKPLTEAALKQGDAVRGRTLFNNLCAVCHVLNGEGGHIGPELTGSNRDNLDYLLQNIGDPSSVVARDYQLNTLTLKDGRVLAGFARAQNDRTLTLQTLAESVTIPLGDILGREVAPISLMPEGLLDSLSETEIRDLMSYLMHK